ncbi:Rossmann-like and DUF2520 domain-containing protein [Salegentibacter sp. HM20]
MIQLVILGAGNLATHLVDAVLKAPNLQLKQVYNHRPESLKAFENKVQVCSKIEDLANADIYILALKDDAISATARFFENSEALVVHTSGGVEMKVLAHLRNYGVFYPLQTFSRSRAVDFSKIPVCLESNSEKNLDKLKQLAISLQAPIYEVDSQQRKSLHVAAVFVNNFSNHLFSLGAEICKENQLPFEILKPLITETTAKLEELNPREAQTGPALRGDQKTIESHLSQLGGTKNEIYKLLTKSIIEFHGKKL